MLANADLESLEAPPCETGTDVRGATWGGAPACESVGSEGAVQDGPALPETAATEPLIAVYSALEANGMISQSCEAERVFAAASDAKNVCCVSASTEEGENKW